MRILFAGNRRRGVECLGALLRAGHDVVGVLAHPCVGVPGPDTVAGTARAAGLSVLQPADVNARDVVETLRAWKAEVSVLAGYGPIVSQTFIDLALRGCINLHGGRLPQYRGSSPMNWALINGDLEVTLSIIQVDVGVDTGDVLLDRTLPVGVNDTIADVQDRADRLFPEMLLAVLSGLEAGTLVPRRQDSAQAVYYPLRFPDDGLVLWDRLTAAQIHNRIRALTDPYPGAFTFLRGRRVKLLRSELAARTVRGEPGRVYANRGDGLLVCATDRCLWIRRAVFEDDQRDVVGAVSRYEQLATLGAAAAAVLGQTPLCSSDTLTQRAASS